MADEVVASDKTGRTSPEDLSELLEELPPYLKDEEEHSEDSENSIDEGALTAYGDISLSDAFNISASTTQDNRLQPRNPRPPMPARMRSHLDGKARENAVTVSLHLTLCAVGFDALSNLAKYSLRLCHCSSTMYASPRSI